MMIQVIHSSYLQFKVMLKSYKTLYQLVLLLIILLVSNVEPQHADLHNTSSLPTRLLNPQSCVWIDISAHPQHINTGNRVISLNLLQRTLSRCSGIFVGNNNNNFNNVRFNDAISFPPFFWALDLTALHTLPTIHNAATAAASSHHSSASSMIIYEQVLHYAAVHCYSDPINPYLKSFNESYCGNDARFSVSYPSTLLHAKNLKHPNHSNHLNHDWIAHDRKAWAQDMDDVLVMYFRGGDILQPKANVHYHQAPCCLFKEAYKLSNKTYVMMIYDERSMLNPCIDVMKKIIPAKKLITAPCTTAICAYNLLGRAREIVVSGVSTFVSSALDLFHGLMRTRYEYFCSSSQANSSENPERMICLTGQTKGLIPWSYTSKTKQIILSRSCKLV